MSFATDDSRARELVTAFAPGPPNAPTRNVTSDTCPHSSE